MKKPASVHIDIAEFSMTVMELSVEERSDWLLSLVKCLSYADPTLNEYGAKLLNEVETYREAERKRKEKYSDKGETRKDTERHGKTEIPKRDRTEQTEQNRQTEQTVLKEKDTIVSKKKAEPKSSFGVKGLVKMTDTEYQKLCDTYGKTETDNKIIDFEACKDFGKYKDHYLTVNKWLRKDVQPKKNLNIFSDEELNEENGI